jgi:catechol 2,3-dioxygenase-like lactoylglutathione lyase family enzyme
MPLHQIDHITLNATDLEKTCAFYRDVLGFRVEPRSGRGFVGAWLLLGDHPYVHLVSRKPEASRNHRGLIDHFAVQATDIPEMRARLNKAGATYHENPIPEMSVHQIVVLDPDGVKVELNFKGQAA